MPETTYRNRGSGRLRRTLAPLLLAASLAASAPAAAQPVPVASAAATTTRASIDDLEIRLRPARARPGELVEIELRGPRVASGAVRLGEDAFPLFSVTDGLLRGYVAVPVTTEPGKRALQIEATRRTGGLTRGDIELPVDDRIFSEHTLRVAGKFTNPTKTQKARMQADRNAFAKAYRAPFGPPLFRGNFASPRGEARLNSRFGEKRVFNGQLQSRHLGLDLEGRTGEPIYAANDGVVRMVRDCFAAGNAVVVSHGAGLFTAYFHLSQFRVALGQKVKKGDLIGMVGRTGRVTGPHLHLSAKLGEVTFDPQALFDFDFFPGAEGGKDGAVTASAKEPAH